MATYDKITDEEIVRLFCGFGDGEQAPGLRQEKCRNLHPALPPEGGRVKRKDGCKNASGTAGTKVK